MAAVGAATPVLAFDDDSLDSNKQVAFDVITIDQLTAAHDVSGLAALAATAKVRYGRYADKAAEYAVLSRIANGLFRCGGSGPGDRDGVIAGEGLSLYLMQQKDVPLDIGERQLL